MEISTFYPDYYRHEIDLARTRATRRNGRTVRLNAILWRRKALKALRAHGYMFRDATCVGCGARAVRLFGGKPRCTLCQAEITRRSVPAFVERAGAPEWAPGEPIDVEFSQVGPDV